MPLPRHEVRDHRLVRRASELEEEAAEADQPEPGDLVSAGARESRKERRLAGPGDQDQRAPPGVIRDVSAVVAGPDAHERADPEGEPDRRLAGAEPADRPDADEAPDSRAGDRADEADSEHRPQAAG
ncbi:MAG TPA: hypothetical protein VF101_18405 [Gaiellaceae bacterium]